MQLHNLKPAAGSNKSGKRIARGQGSGKGGTATRGHKGNQSRAGYKEKRKHEGGQTAIQMRLPKRGFKNSHRRYSSYGADVYTPFNLYLLDYYANERLGSDVIDFDTLYMNGLISKTEMYKVLADGELTKPLFVSAHRFSAAAKEAIEAKGGKAYYIFKISQLQGIVHKYHLKYVGPDTIATYFSHVPADACIHVLADGDVSLKFELRVHKIDELAKAQLEAVGGSVTIL